MNPSTAVALLEPWTGETPLSDEMIIERVLQGETALFEVLMRRMNQRLFRVVRSILKNESEVEDVMQEAYVAAYFCLHQFAGRAKPSTWILRIAIHNAYARLRKHSADGIVLDSDSAENHNSPDPEQLASAKQHVVMLQNAIDRLPDAYRIVLVMREIEQLDTHDTARLLDLSEETVRVRLHRAKAMLRQSLPPGATQEMFGFLGARCDRVVGRVLKVLVKAP